MSKTLVLLRHAKSDWASPNTADIDRPLKKRGLRDARLIGHWLRDYLSENNIEHLHTICSPASRTVLTSNTVLTCLETIDNEAERDADLYLADSRFLQELVRKHRGDDRALMLVSHNPGMHELVEWYAGAELKKFPTCAIACFEFDIDSWSQASPERCASWTMMRPKQLRS